MSSGDSMIKSPDNKYFFKKIWSIAPLIMLLFVIAGCGILAPGEFSEEEDPLAFLTELAFGEKGEYPDRDPRGAAKHAAKSAEDSASDLRRCIGTDEPEPGSPEAAAIKLAENAESSAIEAREQADIYDNAQRKSSVANSVVSNANFIENTYVRLESEVKGYLDKYENATSKSTRIPSAAPVRTAIDGARQVVTDVDTFLNYLDEEDIYPDDYYPDLEAMLREMNDYLWSAIRTAENVVAVGVESEAEEDFEAVERAYETFGINRQRLWHKITDIEEGLNYLLNDLQEIHKSTWDAAIKAHKDAEAARKEFEKLCPPLEEPQVVLPGSPGELGVEVIRSDPLAGDDFLGSRRREEAPGSITIPASGGTATLTVIWASWGEGTVTSDLPGINCKNLGGTCQATFNIGDRVTLEAFPTPPEFSFKKWKGCDRTAGNRCIVNMNGDRTVKAFIE